MLRGMSAIQFREWREYADIEPFDEERADLRAAHIVQTLINVNRDPKKSRISLNKCILPTPDEPNRMNQSEEQPWQQQKMIGMMAAAAFNAVNDSEEAKKKKKGRRK
jgi:hypothetical protein